MNTDHGSLQDVSYGKVSPPSCEAVVISPMDFDQALQRLKQGIEALGLWQIHDIDPQMLLARGGWRIGKARQLMFFHPRYAARLLEANPAALIEIPLKIALLELPDGRVLVRYADVQAQLGRYEGMTVLAVELAQLLRSLVASLQSSTPAADGLG